MVWKLAGGVEGAQRGKSALTNDIKRRARPGETRAPHLSSRFSKPSKHTAELPSSQTKISDHANILRAWVNNEALARVLSSWANNARLTSSARGAV